ncbi:MAG TPA: HIT domain-containing protein [Candidatus Dormibacteraeota bacterium]|nr:HIT domain-containing protein [Candidatus Dormibacteraeota bacterium]
MEILWAPWRMAYIDRDQSPGGVESCIFCDAARPDRNSHDLLIHRTELAICMLNRFPYNPGHVMVAPHRHGGDLVELGPPELLAVMDELKLATRVLRQELKCEGLNGGWNQGRAAGAGIDAHLHFHLVPRWNGDTNFMPILADVKVVPEHLEATAVKLREAFRRKLEQA